MSFLLDGLASVFTFMTHVASPIFNVHIDTSDPDGYAIAGHLTKMCTISITFPDSYWLGDTREEIESLRPTISLVSEESAHSVKNVQDATRGEDHWASDKKVSFDVFLRETKADKYVAHIKFSRYGVHFLGQNTVRYTVRPAEPRSIELTGKEPEPGHGEGDNIYRGGKVRVFLNIKDEHGNTCEEKYLNFNITQTTASVTLISTEFDEWSCHHVVTVRCDQTGMASFGLSLPIARTPRLDLQVKIIPPPVSASKSSVTNLDEIENTEHVAGIPIKVQLVLRDIFGNAVPYKEREKTAKQIEISINDRMTIKRKQISPIKFSSTKVSNLGENSNDCELDVTPLLAGRQIMSFSIANEKVKDLPIEITIVPGPVAEMRILRHAPLVLGNDIVFYPTEQRTVVIEGTDEHGNVVSIDPQMWCLEISEVASQNPIILYGTKHDGSAALKFSYTFEKVSTYNLTIRPKDASQTHVKVPSFVIQVKRPPIDLSRCEAKVCQEEPIFTGGFRPLQLQVLFYDCTSEEYGIEDDEIRHLKVKVDGRICRHSVKRGNQPNELILVLDQIKEGGEKDIQVMYEDEIFSCLEVYVTDVIPYDEKKYFKVEGDQNIRCLGVSRRFLIGEDYANINNIQRVLLDINRYSFNPDLLGFNNKEVVIDLKRFSPKAFSKVSQLFSMLVKGAHHYRGQAKGFDKEREKWKNEATEQYRLGHHQKSKECKAIKEKYGKLMNESNRLASDAIFEFYNDNRHDSEIDLHGQLVADEEQLQAYKRQLLGKRNTKRGEIDGIIERERNEGDEAIRLLRERLTKLRSKEERPSERDWLEIIDGAGHHSKEGQKIRPKVVKFLQKQKETYTKANKGALLITFSEYKGKEPCYANFYCKKPECENAWVSHTSWKGYYQKCFQCDSNGGESKCYPFKLRSFSTRPRRKGTSSIVFTDEDHIRLCQKCQDLGNKDCRTTALRQ